MKKKKLNAAQQRAAFIDNLKIIKDALKGSFGRYIWGVDISLTNTGLTIYDVDKQTFFSMSHKKLKGSRYQRLKQLEEAFVEHVKKYPPMFVVIEGYAFGSKQAREAIGEATYAVKRSLISPKNIPCLIVPPMSLKKFAVGKAHKVGKDEVHHVVTQEWKANTANHDESDSYVLCVIGVNVMMMALTLKIKQYDDKDIVKLIKNNFGMEGVSPQQFEVIYRVIVDDGVDVGRFFA